MAWKIENVCTMKKDDARKLFLGARKNISKDVYEAVAKKALVFLMALIESDIVKIASYYPIKKFNEIDAFDIVERLQIISTKSIKCFLPKINSKNTMDFYEVNNKASLAENKWGILEPIDEEPLHASLIDIMIVPLLCIDKKGYRVGYGKGFYDNYIKKCNKNIITIGLSLFEPIDEIEDIHDNDVPLHYVITSSNIYDFRKLTY